MLTVRAPAATTAFDTFSRNSGSVRAPSSAENSTSSTCRRASSTAAAASSSTCCCDFLSLNFRWMSLVAMKVWMRGRRACVERGGGAFHVERAAARQRGHLRPRELAADGGHGFEIAFGGDREAGLQDVHAQIHQLAGHAQLLGNGHAAAGRLLAVTQSRIEDVYAIAHRVVTNRTIVRASLSIWQIYNFAGWH